VTGNAKVMIYDDIVEAQRKRDVKAAITPGAKRGSFTPDVTRQVNPPVREDGFDNLLKGLTTLRQLDQTRGNVNCFTVFISIAFMNVAVDYATFHSPCRRPVT
jgi:hypothetical protein